MTNSTHNHPFHMVTPSPWPFTMSFSIMNLLLSIINWLNNSNNYTYLMILSSLPLILCLYQWNRDIIRESLYQGYHTQYILNMLKFSMILFIISELFFFLSFFWTYIHSSISPTMEIGLNWPPLGIKYFNPYDIPLLNSLILISSGFSITWAHYSLLMKKKIELLKSMMITITLSMYFSSIQMFEYFNASFCFNDSIYGSIFFMSTGFHGLHVFIGTIFLITTTIRIYMNHFSSIHHFLFEASSWYWHFVDVIWLILYMLIYWWMN